MKKTLPPAGFSMLEMAMVLGIVGIVLGGVWAIAGAARSSAFATRLEQQTLAVVSSVRDYYAARPLPTADGDMTATFRAAEVFPEEMCPSNCISGGTTVVYNAYGGTTTVAIPDTGTSPINHMEIAFTNIQERGCIELASRLGARANETGLSQISIDTDLTSFPVPLSTLSSECDATNTLYLYFKIRP